MFNSLMPSLNIRSLPFVVFMGGFPSRLQNLSSGAIRPGGLLLIFKKQNWGGGVDNLFFIKTSFLFHFSFYAIFNNTKNIEKWKVVSPDSR